MGYHTRDRYGLWVMGYVGKIPANRLGRFKNLWVMKEYGLSWVWVMRESTVLHLQGGRVTLLLHCTLQVCHWLNKPLATLKVMYLYHTQSGSSFKHL
ncbi:hypothetical protein PAXRUDRAFT_798036 [Paxillus rubicundulus Ve08.2h10]|uniref:Uncharacterized protein n=1 Tax=Paxillus rubicundulus Ve08.2h10 TaxID=930991 RepID=A0A0D0DST0_9AGAM|nr:hypothetical protein PAXRUDRAFT_798036 [Paxillus rubicundulus Ve08.2h10]